MTLDILSKSCIYDMLASIPHNPHYLNRYIKLISSRRDQPDNVYTELHHILPKSLFPSYTNLNIHKENGISLSAREHFIVHWILWKTYGGKMAFAFKCMMVLCNEHQERHTKLNSKSYDALKSESRKCLSKLSSERMTLNNPMKDPEIATRAKKSRKAYCDATDMSFKHTNPERCERLSLAKTGEKNPNFGKVGNADMLNAITFQCPYCGVLTNKGNFIRWHGSRCKLSTGDTILLHSNLR